MEKKSPGLPNKTPKKIRKNQIIKAKQYMNYINSQFDDRLSRIEKIKKSHENFERELEILQSGKSKHFSEKKIESIVNNILQEPETAKSSKELSELIEKYAKEKLEMMQKLFESEKNQSNVLYDKLQESLDHIAKAEERLKHQRDQLEVEVKEKTKKLIQAERLSAIGELSARLAHDLRNPLTVIKGSIEIVKAKNNKDETGFSSKQIGMMERAVASMSHQIDDVLEFVKIQTLRTSRNSLLETIGLSIAKIKNQEQLSIIIPEKDVEFVYDTDKLEVVFDNILSNAIDAIQGHGKITFRINDFETEVTIEIKDSGNGASDDILPKIFEPLFTTKQKGTGLGLASCKSIIEQHGGTIYAKNKPSVIIIKLPKMLEISSI